jgi:hypothetical protein
MIHHCLPWVASTTHQSFLLCFQPRPYSSSNYPSSFSFHLDFLCFLPEVWFILITITVIVSYVNCRCSFIWWRSFLIPQLALLTMFKQDLGWKLEHNFINRNHNIFGSHFHVATKKLMIPHHHHYHCHRHLRQVPTSWSGIWVYFPLWLLKMRPFT